MWIKKQFDRLDKAITANKKWKWSYPIFEMVYTILWTSPRVAKYGPFVHSAVDTKRIMFYVCLALIPIYIFGSWNIGHQASLVAEQSQQAITLVGWEGHWLQYMGVPLVAHNFWSNFFIGFVYIFPIYLVTLIVGGVVEVLFAIFRKHDISEGFLVTSALLPLTLPPHIPLWQVALAILFGVIVAKEMFGGQGKNFINPALAARAFLYFGYPSFMTGGIWVAVDGYTKATPLSYTADTAQSAINFSMPYGVSWWDSFIGLIPGSNGETSTLLILLSLAVLLFWRVVNWRYIAATLIGTIVMASILNLVGSATEPMFFMPWYWHVVLGGYAFGLVFMVTEPVTGAITNTGRWLYGLLIGSMVVFIRVANPAYPEAMMLAILFGNVFAPLLDYIVMQVNIMVRRRRYGKS